MFWLGVFIGSLFILIKASDHFIKASEKVGYSLKIPSFIIGVTIVAIGTSLPELASSIFAVTKGSSEIVAGNVVGSNIANIFLVLGIAAVAGGNIKLLRSLIRVDLPMLIGASLLFTLSIWDGEYTVPEALISLFLVAIYISYTVTSQKKHEDKDLKQKIKRDIRKRLDEEKSDRKLHWQSFVVLGLSLLFLYLSANFVIESVLQLSELLSIGTEVIALTAVAIGTSLPELFVSINAVMNKKEEIVVGNILGSTIFNSLAVMGIPALFGTIIITNELISFSLPIMVIATLMYFFITQDREITKWEGWLLIIFYVFFIGKVVGFV